MKQNSASDSKPFSGTDGQKGGPQTLSTNIEKTSSGSSLGTTDATKSSERTDDSKSLIKTNDSNKKSTKNNDSSKVATNQVIQCYICGRGDGTVLKICKCKERKAAHFECLQIVIINNQSMICRTCQNPYDGIQAVYAKKRISRFFTKYVRLMAYRVIGIPLFLLLLIRVIFVKSEAFHGYEKYFWILFAVVFLVSLAIVGVYTYRGIQQIKEYNRNNNDILDVQITRKSNKSSETNTLKES